MPIIGVREGRRGKGETFHAQEDMRDHVIRQLVERPQHQRVLEEKALRVQIKAFQKPNFQVKRERLGRLKMPQSRKKKKSENPWRPVKKKKVFKKPGKRRQKN